MNRSRAQTPKQSHDGQFFHDLSMVDAFRARCHGDVGKEVEIVEPLNKTRGLKWC